MHGAVMKFCLLWRMVVVMEHGGYYGTWQLLSW